MASKKDIYNRVMRGVTTSEATNAFDDGIAVYMYIEGVWELVENFNEIDDDGQYSVIAGEL